MRNNKLSRWKVGKTRIMADRNASPEVKAEIVKRVEEKVMNSYEAIVGRRAVESIQCLQADIIKSIQFGDNVDVQGKYAELQALTSAMSFETLKTMEEKENQKKAPNINVLKWIQEARIELMKASAEIRKANEGQYEMKHGKKTVNVNVDKETLDKWLTTKKGTNENTPSSGTNTENNA